MSRKEQPGRIYTSIRRRRRRGMDTDTILVALLLVAAIGVLALMAVVWLHGS